MSQVPTAPTALLPHDSYVGELYRINISFICVDSVIIILRLFVRGFVVKHVAVDDYLMVAAGILADVFSAMAIVGASWSLKRDKFIMSDSIEKASDMDSANICTTFLRIHNSWTTQRMLFKSVLRHPPA